MGKSTGMLLPVMLLGLSCLATVKCDRAWLTNLPDSRKLNTLAFIGTHDSASSGSHSEFAKTQSMGMTAQLEAGIRVFDMRVRRTSNVFAMHHGFVYLNMMFGDVVNEVSAYLRKNPKELVIMLMQEEYIAEKSSLSECEILEEHYVRIWSNLFVQHWSIEDTIGQHRGKILLAQSNRGFWGCVTQLPCAEQNRWQLNSRHNREAKSNDIRELQSRVSAIIHDAECYINYLSATGGTEVLWLSPETIANVEWPADDTRSGNVMRPGANALMASIFYNPQNTLYIIMADFPTEMLINIVVNSNINCICPQ